MLCNGIIVFGKTVPKTHSQELRIRNKDVYNFIYLFRVLNAVPKISYHTSTLLTVQSVDPQIGPAELLGGGGVHNTRHDDVASGLSRSNTRSLGSAWCVRWVSHQ